MKKTDITRECFDSDLRVFATRWIIEKWDAIIEQADELFDNDATRHLVHEFAKLYDEIEEARTELFRAKLHNEPTYASEQHIEFMSAKKSAIQEVLYDLIIR